MTAAANTGLVTTAAHDGTTGAVTYWQLSGDVDSAALAVAWQAQGLDPAWLPAPASPAEALRRVALALATPTCLVRKHPKGGWVAVEEAPTADSESLAYTPGVRYYLHGETSELTVVPADAKGAAEVTARYTAALKTIAPRDVSGWLVKLVANRLGSVLLRETGGIYFVPRGSIETLHKVKAAIAATTKHTVYEIPAVQSAEVVIAVFAALQREVADEIAVLETDLANENIRASTLVNRIAHCDTVISKVAVYEKLMGKVAGDTMAKLADLKARMNAAFADKKASTFDLLEVEAATDEEKAEIERKADATVADIKRRKASMGDGRPAAPAAQAAEEPAPLAIAPEVD